MMKYLAVESPSGGDHTHEDEDAGEVVGKN